MRFLFVACFFFLAVQAELQWYKVSNLNKTQTQNAKELGIFFGEVGFSSSLSLLATPANNLHTLFPEAVHLFTLHSDITVCIVKSLENFETELWRSEEHGITALGYKKGYSPECFSADTAYFTTFVPLQPIVPIRRKTARPDTGTVNPVIEKYVESLSQDRITDDVKWLSTNYDGEVDKITRNSYTIKLGVGGCADESWRCLANVSKELLDRIHETISSSSNRDLFTVTTEQYNSEMGPNIVVSYQGKTDDLVVLGAHLDSRNVGAGKGQLAGLAPGADDNGSGSAINIEILRSLASGTSVFQNTIHIIWFTGEEQGLFGSRAASQGYRSRGDNVIAMFNNDMVGYTNETVVLAFMDKFSDPELTNDCKTISQTYLPDLPVGDATACCSDQQSFYEQGFPSAGIFETASSSALYPDYHKSSDRYDNELINYNQIYQFGQANFACLLTYANPVEN